MSDLMRTDAEGKTQLSSSLVLGVTALCLAGGIAAGAYVVHYRAKDEREHLPEVGVNSALMLYLLALVGGLTVGAVAMNTTMSDAPQLGA